MNYLTSLIAGMALCCLACVSDNEPGSTTTSPKVTPADSTQGISFLSLGDSYTIGESVPEAARWSVQFAEMLRKDGLAVASPDIIARTGWTTAELATGIIQAKNDKTYDLVSLLIGVNNQYRGQTIDRYRNEFRSLLDTSVKFAKGNKKQVFVLSTPDWGVSPFGKNSDRAKITREIDAFNAVAKEECEKAGILFIDITPISRSGLNDPSMFASDDLHFSGKMYGLWAKEALPKVKALLGK
ncbi:SGNH/GDSL hydrolase family protein [Persicitalea jodogahamensis]|uniref:Lysophospholipase n=1 Tax=Persicitalea jodogahamensis TaxID=402147 RepID=A0A8J3D7B5_9BACT|nr:SGNH/GDSL hydrolase family protein [Persicitalea jodogahamensis]GHB84320.1 lysophospholipase [Persicitalea jodogahamensis]